MIERAEGAEHRRQTRVSPMTSQDVKMCDCAGCGTVMLGESMAKEALGPSLFPLGRPPMVHGRIDGRPYCRPCFANVKTAEARRRRLRKTGGTPT